MNLDEYGLPVVPKGWEVKPFRRVFSESSEVNGPTPHGPMLSVSSYRGIEVKDYSHDSQRRTDEMVENYRVVRPGQLVVNTMWLNYGGLGMSSLDGHVSPAYRAYSVTHHESLRFLNYLLRSTAYIALYTKFLTGIRPNSLQMSRDDLMKVPVLLPPLAEQECIADYLDRETATIDALIEKQRDFLKVLSSRKQALVDEAVRFPFVLPLKRDTVLVTSGPRGWAQFYAGDGTRFIRITDIQRDSITLSDHSVRYVDAPDEGEARRASTRAGDLVVSITADLGSVGLVDEARAGAVVSQHVAIVRLAGRHWDPRFASYALKSSALKDQFAGAAYGGTKVQLSLGDVRDLQVPAPPLEQQREIADHLDRETAKIDALIAKAERFMELAQERRAALITAAVTGQIEIPTED